MTYGTTEDVLTEISTFLERDYTLPSGRVIRIRELTAGERLGAQQAALASGKMDVPLLNAIIVQQGTINPAIPKSSIPQLVEGRAGVMEKWSNAIWALSEASPEAMKSGHPPPNSGQQDAGAGATDPGADGSAEA